MNIYVCSTVRHLLFALCRANHEIQQQHHLVFFADYQQTSLSDWNLADLPANIHVHKLLRSDFRQRLKNIRFGWLSYWFAMRKLPAPAWLTQPIVRALTKIDPELIYLLQDAAGFRLWLFNERNKMARIFRLLTPCYSDIEEGEGNYLKAPSQWWKSPMRIARGLPASYRVLGDDPRCEEIWVIHPERLPELVRNKGRLINFISGNETSRLISCVFGEQPTALQNPGTSIVATQPLDGLAGIQLSDKQRIYDQIIRFLENQGQMPVLKIHPSENIEDYAFLSNRTTFSNSKAPLEALLIGSPHRIFVISICSSAGLGFESFCRRVSLCKTSDYKANIRLWLQQPAMLDAELELRLKTQASTSPAPS